MVTDSAPEAVGVVTVTGVVALGGDEGTSVVITTVEVTSQGAVTVTVSVPETVVKVVNPLVTVVEVTTVEEAETGAE